ncbi:2-hydroxychromene-2-carboxylate isomerase [Paraliomyxa miuraensis]|uniref:2-hydroxychromene-2-carboxylate isomerase n=1 Tax=Paraliomyxa miuraensis TaxID=376150 RepID=UPI0022569C32|nr:2-hydroxychromene-2-carboxylate isomerase [Paraliomyxa miuraensis]MCX4245919.1 2-hydroxychromene-2-carboxylate isomerase [Paraliomyxa miuraensis]
MTLDFYFDVVCPYAYLAACEVEALGQRCGVEVRWRPILLGGLLRAVGAPDDPNASMGEAKRRLLGLDRQRSAARLGVPLRTPRAHSRRTVEAMRLCLAAPPGALRRAVSRSLFDAYWVKGDDVADPRVLAEVAGRHGLAADAFAMPDLREGLRAATAEAAARGAFGVPSFVVGERLWWGRDRLPLVERALGGTVADPWEATASVVPSGTRVSFFHDFSSPFSYLAAARIEGIAHARGIRVEWVPILLGALFREIGTANVPLLEMNPTKQAYVRRDLHDWAERWGVPFVFPRHFPLRSVLPLRVALGEPAATLPIYRAAWAEDRAVDTPEGLHAVLEAAGLPAADLLARAQHVSIKDALRSNTERARGLGVCGVPTMEVQREGRSVLLWGQDRLDLLAAVLDGWWPPGEA